MAKLVKAAAWRVIPVAEVVEELGMMNMEGFRGARMVFEVERVAVGQVRDVMVVLKG